MATYRLRQHYQSDQSNYYSNASLVLEKQVNIRTQWIFMYHHGPMDTFAAKLEVNHGQPFNNLNNCGGLPSKEGSRPGLVQWHLREAWCHRIQCPPAARGPKSACDPFRSLPSATAEQLASTCHEMNSTKVGKNPRAIIHEVSAP